MNEREATLGAAIRVTARRQARELRHEVLTQLLRGADVPPELIDSPERQQSRAKLLNLEASSSSVGREPRSSRVLYEAVIGSDDTLPSRFLSTGERAARSVGRIVAQHGSGGVLFGTGSLISQHLVITNNHVLENSAVAGNAVIELGYYEVEPARFAQERKAFVLDPTKFFYTSTELDYTLVGVVNEVDGARTADYGMLDLISESGKALIGERVNIVHHPGGRPQSLSIRANAVVDTFDNWVHYEADTEAGSSGAAVFNDAWQLVAVHHASVPQQNGGIINEGIRVSAIVQDLLDALQKS